MTQRMISNNELWQNTLVQLELNTSAPSFNTWFKNTHIINREANVVYIGVPSKIVKEWLIDKHSKLILKALRSIDPDIRSIEFSIHRINTAQKNDKKNITTNTSPMDLPSNYIDKKDNLNPRYTFDNFIIGPFNELAYAAAKVVIEKPGLTYNPLFIYGSTGRGKTHLIQAIGNYFKKINSRMRVLYVTSEKFAIDYINSVRIGKANNFKDQYRMHDVLIMDDVQFIANTEKTQEELFHLFNAFRDNNKQIIFSSDKHPALLPGFEDRLLSRFAAGMVAEIPEPDIESRSAIIRAKIESHGFILPDIMIKFLAENVKANIRELEGIINSIVCSSQHRGKTISETEIRNLVKHSIKQNNGVDIEDVVKKVSQYYGVQEKTMYEKSRKKEIVKPRQVTMYILREIFDVSFPTIGDKFGGRDHTTVIHSCDKIKEEMNNSSSFQDEVDYIVSLVRG